MKLTIGGDTYWKVTSEYGATEFFRDHIHKGIDLALPNLTPLYTPLNAVVEKIVDFGNKNIGKGIHLKLEDGNTVILGHLSDIKVKLGQEVNVGDLLGHSGNTGNVFGQNGGYHLHIGMKNTNGEFVNPQDFEQPFQNLYASLDNSNMDLSGLPTLDDIIYPKELISDRISELNGSENYSSMFGGLKQSMDNVSKSIDNFNKTMNDIQGFFSTWKTEGFSYAVFDKSWQDVILDSLKWILDTIATNGDLFFLMPAIAIMLATFFFGKNKFTKWTLPLWFAFFVATVISKII